MKKSIFTLLLAFAAITIGISSCAKYDEGSNFSIYSAKARVVNTWSQQKVTYSQDGNSTENTGFSEIKATFSKDGSYSYSYKYLGFPVDETGTWQFNSDKTELILTESNNDVETWSILRLKNKELKVTTPSGNGTLTIEFAGE